MTEDRKPETSGMAEVSAKFKHEVTVDTALSALWQEWQQCFEENDKAAADNANWDETFAALMAVEDRIENTPAHSVEEAAVKLRVAKRWIDMEYPNGPSDDAKMPRKESLTLSALADLERLAGAVSKQGMSDQHLLDLEREVLERGSFLNRTKPGKDHTEEERARLFAKLTDMEVEIIEAPAHTAIGVAVKLRRLETRHFEGGPWWSITGASRQPWRRLSAWRAKGLPWP